MKPLVLLDVDGVVNDIGSLYSHHGIFGPDRPDYEIIRVPSHGHVVHIPAFMPELIQNLTANCEVRWLTTWRGRANDEIVDALGIDKLEVITDGYDGRNVAWKPEAAYDVALEALEAGREVWWIEDFYGRVPAAKMPRGVRFIDTAASTEYPALLPSMVPEHLLGDGEFKPAAHFSVAHSSRNEPTVDEPTGAGGIFSKIAAFFS